jgi:hypothetical protein
MNASAPCDDPVAAPASSAAGDAVAVEESPPLVRLARAVVPRPFRGPLRQLALAAVDRGWFGLKPLECHVVVCGFARSGSTLLQVMAETCVVGARTFGYEMRALDALDFLRNHPLMITKFPDDIFRMDEVRAVYRERKARPRFVLTLRDPRAVLTSIHGGGDRSRYYMSVERWRRTYGEFMRAREAPDVAVVRYEDLVLRPRDVQRQLTEFLGWKVVRDFDQFHTRAAERKFQDPALNGLRPLDPSTIDNWRKPKHRARIAELLTTMPELPERVAELGYEPDTAWTREYLEESAR